LTTLWPFPCMCLCVCVCVCVCVSSRVWRVHSFFASQTLHNRKISKKKIRRSLLAYKSSLMFFCFISNGPYTPPLPSPSAHLSTHSSADPSAHSSAHPDTSCLFCDISNVFCDMSNVFYEIPGLFCDISNLFCDTSMRCS
jgi:hypothetical protein